MPIPRPKYLRPEDITPDFLAGIADEAAPRNVALLNIASREAQPYNEAMPNGAMMRRAVITPADRRAAVVGYMEHGKRIADDQFVETLVEPFHLASERELTIRNPGVELGADGRLTVSADVLAQNVAQLTRAHTSIMVEAIASMLGYAAYSYADNPDPLKAEKVFSLSYASEITSLTDVGGHAGISAGDFKTATAKALAEYRLMRVQYRQQSKQDPDAMLISGTTAAVMMGVNEIKAAYTPLQSSDPDNRPGTRGAFMFDGILHIVLEDYIMINGSLAPAIPDGYGILFYQSSDVDGRSAIRYGACANKRNGKDASAPVFGLYNAGSQGDPLQKLIVSSYDNMIPFPERKGAIRKVKLYT